MGNENVSRASQLLDERDSLRADRDDWKARARLTESLIVEAHFRAFGPRQYAYTDPRSACDLLVADITATQNERDQLRVELAEARERAETAEAQVTRLRAGLEECCEYAAMAEQHERDQMANRIQEQDALIKKLHIALKQLAKWLEESRVEAMDAKRQAASDRALARLANTDLESCRVELSAAKEEILKCVQWQHDLRQELAASRDRESLLQHAVDCHNRNLLEHSEALGTITGKLSDLLARHRKDGITALFLALEELIQETK